jgi:NAD(P)H-hydrate repair Nnr-like enzyme with NAD(P)H-hydrate dehydratase domain
MLELLQKIAGNVGGLDIGVIIVSLGYVARCGAEIFQWFRARKEQRIDQTILDAINWIYINKVQATKKNKGDLTLEEGNNALMGAADKAVELAEAAGIDLEKELGAGNVPARVQSVFARVKAALKTGNKPEVLSNEQTTQE